MRKYLRLLRLPAAQRKRATMGLASRALHDERGGEVVEYALVIGLIVAACISTISCVGTKVLGKWNSSNSAM